MGSNRVDKMIEISCWVIMSFLLVKFVPKNRLREAHLAFLFKQVITWLFGLLVVEKDQIEYPHRLFFKKANKSSFTFEYFVYPGLCALFNLYYPEKRSSLHKALYYFLHTSIIVVFELFAVKFTKLIRYKKWAWYWSFITIWITYYLSRIYHRWFYKDRSFRKKIIYNFLK